MRLNIIVDPNEEVESPDTLNFCFLALSPFDESFWEQWHSAAPGRHLAGRPDGPFPVHAGSAESVSAPSAIDYVSDRAMASTIACWASLARFGGRVTVTGLNALALFDAVLTGDATLANANEALFASRRQGVHAHDAVRAALEAAGVAVDSVELDGLYYSISGVRQCP